MEELPGAFGSSGSFALRLGQTVFSSASLFFMCLDVSFYSYTAFWQEYITVLLALKLLFCHCKEGSRKRGRFPWACNTRAFHLIDDTCIKKFIFSLLRTNFSENGSILLVWLIEFFVHSFLVIVMALVIPWSITLLVIEGYTVFIQKLPIQRRLISTIISGDIVLSYLSVAAASSTEGVSNLLLESGSHCPAKLCARFQFSAAMAFLSWFLTSASCLFNFWLFCRV